VGKILFLQSLMMINIPIHHIYGQSCGPFYTKLWEAFFTTIGTKNMTDNTVWYKNERKIQQSWEPHYSGLLRCEQWQLLTDTLGQPIAPILEYSFLDSWPLKLGPKSLPRTLVRNYHFSLHNSPEEHSSHILHGGSLNFNSLLSLTA
jgi:hypothetical protein